MKTPIKDFYGRILGYVNTDKDGNNRISWEIQNAHAEFCGGKSDNGAVNTTVTNSNENDFSVIENSVDDIPF